MPAGSMMMMMIPAMLMTHASNDGGASAAQTAASAQTAPQVADKTDPRPNHPIQPESATFGAGCFWCVEAVFEEMIGVIEVESGYSGGHVRNPSYREVVGGRTGHAEVARIVFDPTVIGYEDLLRVFWHTHDPTTPNRQGADVGPQYRSAVFYHSDGQREAAEKVLAEIEASGLWEDPIVTEISPLVNYFRAEDYHQDYYANNPTAPYCAVVIAPKLAKFRREFAHLLKKGASR